ncbi:MAG: Holliday junction resolvase RuvX [Saprospiraceae bacterium]|nr:Holliday junction resolvase RuvX [Saprospiraceae bacterium]
MSRILAIDYGLKRTGLAVTDSMQIIASALTTVPSAEVIDFLKRYTTDEEVECLVVGLPTHTDGSPAQFAPEVDKFVATLEKTFPDLPIYRQDERFTSATALRIIVESGIKKQKRREKALVDKIAAALILEYWMEKHKWKK